MADGDLVGHHDRQTRMFAQLTEKGPRDFYRSRMQVKMCQGKPPCPPIVPVLVKESEAGDFWAWWDNKDQVFCMVYPIRKAVEICFPYGTEVEEARGGGEVLRVEVIEEEKGD